MPNPIRHLSPCIVANGTLFNKRDIIRSLDTLDTVNYIDTINGDIIGQGKGVVVKVFASRENSTLILNGALFINVNSFEYLDFNTDESGKCVFNLIGNERTLMLVPESSVNRSHLRPHQGVLFNNDEIPEEEPCATLMDDWYDDDYDDL